MLVFDGNYMLERKGDPGANPAHACAWRLKIIDFSSGGARHAYIRPYAVLAFRKEGGIFKSSCAESLGNRICKDFGLNVDDILWVEAFPDLPGALYVAVFTPRYQEMMIDYTVSWRPILENEQAAVAPWC
ncbi:hypothetical protein DSCA_56440 [Desulfosarcina alkanivorans]|uniref:Uncharacterized protein n=2 Tax=Desulfosarcina alkanivorans TaxID=571177 RepID=A0A5K7YZN4_9BACT|nr:hypothetical protein DSCA_56440 [Desulfosarcina alkanivorans]